MDKSVGAVETNMGTIHGYKIIGMFACPERKGLVSNRRIVMVDRGTETPRWVIATHIEGHKEWLSGSYIQDQAKALVDFCNRCKREY